MLTVEENDLLCRVEGDAPMGRMMRRHWIPACMSEEVAEPDGDPVRLRLLGEDLIAFRDSKGRLGVIGEYCPHRRASLVFARNEECGLRCLYHGWKFDVEGKVTDMPSEPPDSKLKDRVRHTAYPTREAGGFVWVYMGARVGEAVPEFRPPPWAKSATTRVGIAKMHVAANWAQVLEGAIDSAHSSSLHSSNIRPAKVAQTTADNKVMSRPSTDKAPRLQVQQTDFGMRYAAIRRPITNADTHDYVRITVFVAPLTVLIPPNNMYALAQLSVPMDDTNTMFYFLNFSETDGMEQEAFRKMLGAQVGIDLDENYRKKRTFENRYLQDRKAMKLGDFTGIHGIPTQDMAMWETMGGIADRSKELLGASDVAIVQFRRMMVEAVRAFRDGAPPIGSADAVPRTSIRAFEGIVPKSTDWRDLARPEEAAPLQVSELADSRVS